MTADAAEPWYWSTGLVRRITRTDRGYPETIVRALGRAAPVVLTVLGRADALLDQPVALLCSEACPPELMLRSYDLACELAQRGVTVVSGFHSVVERECLRVLLAGRKPVIWCPARGVGPRLLSPAQARAITDGHLVVATPFSRCATRVTAATARCRNRFVAALADGLVALHVSEGGAVEAACRSALRWGKPVRVLAAPATLHDAGVLPLRAGELPGFLPAWAWGTAVGAA